MLKFLVRNMIQSIVVLAVLMALIFVIVYYLGDPVALMAPVDATKEQLDALRQQLGLDDPLLVQMARFAGGVLHFDFGDSLRFREPALPIAAERLGATLELGAVSIVLAVVVGVGLGLAAAISPRRAITRIISAFSFATVSLVEFWVGLVLILVFAVQLGILPTSGRQSWDAVILPAVVVALRGMGRIAQFTATSLETEMAKPYARAAIARGLTRRRVVAVHGLKNIAVAVVTVIGAELVQAVSSVAIVETVFAWPGVGALLIQAIHNRDLPLVQACVFLLAILIVLINLATDIMYGFIDRRVRLT